MEIVRKTLAVDRGQCAAYIPQVIQVGFGVISLSPRMREASQTQECRINAAVGDSRLSVRTCVEREAERVGAVFVVFIVTLVLMIRTGFDGKRIQIRYALTGIPEGFTDIGCLCALPNPDLNRCMIIIRQ